MQQICISIDGTSLLVHAVTVDATGAYFNLTMAQVSEVAASHMALWRHVEAIAIGNAADEE
jgi:uncharacterized HAD superfamily protein